MKSIQTSMRFERVFLAAGAAIKKQVHHATFFRLFSDLNHSERDGPNMCKKVWPCIGFSAVALVVGGLSALFSSGAMQDYENWLRPPLAPPGWVFPVVWTILYILMGISADIVWCGSSGRARRYALGLWGGAALFQFLLDLSIFQSSVAVVRVFLAACATTPRDCHDIPLLPHQHHSRPAKLPLYFVAMLCWLSEFCLLYPKRLTSC